MTCNINGLCSSIQEVVVALRGLYQVSNVFNRVPKVESTRQQSTRRDEVVRITTNSVGRVQPKSTPNTSQSARAHRPTQTLNNLINRSKGVLVPTYGTFTCFEGKGVLVPTSGTFTCFKGMGMLAPTSSTFTCIKYGQHDHRSHIAQKKFSTLGKYY